MDITLNHEEISVAITNYVGNQGINLENKETKVDLTAGRGGNGYSATIAITDPVPQKPKKTPQKRRSTKPVSENKTLNALGLDSLDDDAKSEADRAAEEEDTIKPEFVEQPEGESPFKDTAPEPEVETETVQEPEAATEAPKPTSSLFG